MERRTVETFEDLVVWQNAIELAKRVYVLTNGGPFSKDFGLKDQLQRAAVSISANIAEGFERGSRTEYLQFLNVAKGSVGEVRSLLRIALEIGYVDSATHDGLRSAAVELSRRLSTQIKALKATVS
jgi:four helix bundle protein